MKTKMMLAVMGMSGILLAQEVKFDFEQIGKSPNGPAPNGWIYYKTVNGTSGELRISESAFSGSFALEMKGFANAHPQKGVQFYPVMKKRLPVAPGDWLQFTFQAKGKGEYTAGAYLYDKRFSFLGGTRAEKRLSGTEKYQEQTITVPLPESIGKGAAFVCCIPEFIVFPNSDITIDSLTVKVIKK